MVADLAVSTLLGGRWLETWSCDLVKSLLEPTMQTGWIETIPHGQWECYQIVDVEELEGSDIVTMTLWADHAPVFHSRQKDGPRKVPS